MGKATGSGSDKAVVNNIPHGIKIIPKATKTPTGALNVSNNKGENPGSGRH
jgi:hypothetical protein